MYGLFKIYWIAERIRLYAFLALTVLLLLYGCSGVPEEPVKRIIINKAFTEPVEIIEKELFRLDSNQIYHPVDIKFDKANNMYIVEYYSKRIIIFDYYGKFLDSLTFDNRVSFFTLCGDTGFIKLSRESVVKKTDLKGNVMSEISAEGYYPVDLEPVDCGSYIGTFRKSLTDKNDFFTEYSLKLVGRELKEKKTISSIFDSYFSGNIDFETSVFPYAVDKERNSIYIALSSNELYSIFIFDTELKLKHIIQNEMPRVKISDAELDKRKENAKRFRLPFNDGPGYKIFVENMQIGPEGELWVRRAHNTNIYGLDSAIYDIFNINGKYIKSVKIPYTGRIGTEIIRDGRLYIIRPFESEISVYSLKNLNHGTNE